MADRLIWITTALAVVAVAAVISYRHTYELVRAHGESGATARLVPFTVDGLIWAASMVILDASRRSQSVPTLAKWVPVAPFSYGPRRSIFCGHRAHHSLDPDAPDTHVSGSLSAIVRLPLRFRAGVH